MAVEPALVFFDGDCELCNRVRAFGDGHGRPGALRFVPIQDPEGQEVLGRHGLAERAKDTLVVVAGDRPYTESSGIVQVAKRLRWPWRAQAALWLVPRPLRNAGYRFVAKRRHKLFQRAR